MQISRTSPDFFEQVRQGIALDNFTENACTT